MKRVFVIAAALLLATTFWACAPSPSSLELGSKAPMTETKMKATDDKSYSLADIKKKNGLLVIFSCNTCPFVIGWEDQYPILGKLAAEKNIGMVLVNSNEAKRKNEDSMEAMKKHYAEAGYNTPYVVDENHKLADAFGARTTPHVFLFDKDMKLVYKGSINDLQENRDKKVNNAYLENAINNMLQGKEINPATTKEIGCTIKRV